MKGRFLFTFFNYQFMEILKQNVGFEVDSKKLKLSFQQMRQDLSIKIVGSRSFDNSLKSFPLIKQWIEKKKANNVDVHITMEATGVYYENIAYYFFESSDYKVHVELGNRSNAFFKSLKEKSKTDEADAKGLGQMGLERNLVQWNPGSDQMRGLKKLSRERLRLIKIKTMTFNQLHTKNASYKPEKSIIKRAGKHIVYLDKQIKAIEKELVSDVEKDKDLNDKIANVCTAKGVAFTTAITVVAELNGFALIRNRSQLVSYCGYDILKKESGISIRGVERISKQGNSYVRQALYMPAMCAARHDEHHRNYYKRIVRKTSIKLKGNVAIQRKLLLLIYALFTKNEPYDPNYHVEITERLKQNYKAKLEMAY